MSKKIKDTDLIDQLKTALEDVMPEFGSEDLPAEALPLGTYVRPTRYNTLGIIVDAFYGDVDKDGQKIIMYTVLYTKNPDPYKINSQATQMFVSNEYEYEIIAYLMIPPCNIKNLTSQMTRGIL